MANVQKAHNALEITVPKSRSHLSGEPDFTQILEMVQNLPNAKMGYFWCIISDFFESINHIISKSLFSSF